MWYRTGTVAVTASSAVITGTGTAWLANAAAGEAFVGPDGKAYEIQSVDTNTQLTLASAYLGTTASGQSYAIAPTQSFIRDLADQVSAVAAAYGDVADAVDAGKVAFSASGIDINGGTIDGVVIGGSSAAAGTFTTLAATGNVTLGDAATDTATVNGYMGVGSSTVLPSIGLRLANNALTSATQIGAYFRPTSTSAATSYIAAAYFNAGTAAASFTCADAYGIHVENATLGAGSTITTQTGVLIADQTHGAANYGVRSLVSSGTNKWNIYASGTAANYFAGGILVGVTSATTNGGKIETSNGITFPAIHSACTNANTLDDYEEGTWTPQVYYQNATDQATATDTTQSGWYVKIGRLVVATYKLTFSQATATASLVNDNIGIKSLPFTADSGTGRTPTSAVTVSGMVTATPCVMQVAAGGTAAVLTDMYGTGNLANEVGTGSHTFIGTLVYQASA